MAEDIEKRVAALEKKIDHIDAAFNVFRDVLIKIQNENVQLRKNRDFLLGKHKDLMKKSVNKDKLASEIKQKLVDPFVKEINEDAQLVRKLTSQLHEKEPSADGEAPSRLDELFVLVMNRGVVTTKEAANYFDVHELQIEEWAATLEDHGLVDIVKNNDRTELRKSVYR